MEYKKTTLKQSNVCFSKQITYQLFENQLISEMVCFVFIELFKTHNSRFSFPQFTGSTVLKFKFLYLEARIWTSNLNAC